jgi:anaphase-promoting complex subunit 4
MVPNGRPLQSGRTPHEIDLSPLAKYISHTFGPDDRLLPAKLEVNGKKNRRFVVVLGEDGRQMRIFDLDYSEGDEQVTRAFTGRDGDGDAAMEDG